MMLDRNVREAVRFATWLCVAASLSGCAKQAQLTGFKQTVAAVEVYFGPPPFAYRVGPELTTSATDSATVHRQLSEQGARLGCHAVTDVVIPRPARGVATRSWGFCAYRVSTGR